MGNRKLPVEVLSPKKRGLVGYARNVFGIPSTLNLLALSLFSIAMSAVRVAYSNTAFFTFLPWNLFLAFVPWLVASVMYLNDFRNRAALASLILLWLLFFPNAPYILTDILHLGKGGNIPVWFDLILLLSYSLTGMLYGFVSLSMIEEKLRARGKLRFHALISAALIYVSCFGIYLGRFLRWNSWDILTNMPSVAADVVKRLVMPFEYPTTWGFTILFGTLLNLMYLAFRNFNFDGKPTVQAN